MTEIRYFKTDFGYVAGEPVGAFVDGVAIVTEKGIEGRVLSRGVEVALVNGRAILPREAIQEGKNTVFLDTGTGYAPLEPFEVHGKAITLCAISDKHIRELLYAISDLKQRVSTAEKMLEEHSAKIESTIF